MRHSANEGFLINTLDIRSDIFIPRYYDPRIKEEAKRLKPDHELISLGSMVANGQLRHDQGDYVPKIHYGTGPYPYIRTSDLANWELKASPKHGIAQEVFEDYSAVQGVRPEDILFVHEGTYLIGSAAMVTVYDGPMLYQHHLAKFRVLEGAGCGPYFFLAALESPFVQRQIRSKQFSADIIDSVVGRISEVEIAIPKDKAKLEHIEYTVKEAILTRATAREQLSYLFRELDDWLRSETPLTLDMMFAWGPSAAVYQGRPAFLGHRSSFIAFAKPQSELKGDILLPKYYDPYIEDIASAYEDRCEVVTVSALTEAEVISLDTGDEIGKINYGSGTIPFVRTSDMGSYELKQNPKQGVSEDVWLDWKEDQDVRPGDILLVRDGTYLVGSAVMVTEDDLPLIYCGGIIKIRCKNKEQLPPALLYVLLNVPFVRRQMRNKQFTRDVIDTLGKRLLEVMLPLPKDQKIRQSIALKVEELLAARNKARSTLNHMVTSL